MRALIICFAFAFGLLSPFHCSATTIAYDGKTLAADSQATAGTIKSYFQKLTRCGDAFVACSGEVDTAVLFRRWWEAGHDPKHYPKIKDDFAAFVLTRDGKVLEYWDKPVGVEVIAPDAIGTGAKAAIGAMKAGANAEHAVRIAAEIDLFTGGDVVSHTAQELQEKK